MANKTWAFEVETEDTAWAGEVRATVFLNGYPLITEWHKASGPDRFDDAACWTMDTVASRLSTLLNGISL